MSGGDKHCVQIGYYIYNYVDETKNKKDIFCHNLTSFERNTETIMEDTKTCP